MSTADPFGRLDEIMEFRASLTPETDRGCALMGAAYLDVQLEELLRKHFVDNSKVANELIGQSRPLASFSSRIDLAYLLGLISLKAHRDLHLVRKIRNDFGHDPKALSFNDAAMQSRCRELHFDGMSADDLPRDKFHRVVMGLAAAIHVALLSTEHAAVRPESDQAKAKQLHEALSKQIQNVLGDPAPDNKA